MHRLHVCAAIAALVVPSLVQAEQIYGITVPTAGVSSLVSFDSATPGTVGTVAAITGINAGHTLRGIDFRPSNGLLYAMSTGATTATDAQLYTIDLATAVASPVGGSITLTGNTSTRVSLDFNPVANALRVITGSAQSYRVNANTGALIAQDTSVATAGTGAVPLISGVAYTNNNVGATQTTLYAYDFLLDNLGTIGGINGVPSPNTGTFNIVGNSGIVTGDAGLGFDISGATGTAYASVDDFNGSAGVNAEFFTVDLSTGAVSQVGPDDYAPVLDISVLPIVPEPTTFATLALAGAFLRRRRD